VKNSKDDATAILAIAAYALFIALKVVAGGAI
jgi:hypothetical protein